MHSSNSLQKIILNYTIALIPLVIYGFYRNGILLYKYYDQNFFLLLKPLIVVFSAFFLGLLADKYYLNKNSTQSFTPIILAISAMLIPPTTNILLFFLLLIVITALLKYLPSSLNPILLPRFLIIIWLFLSNNYSYLNSYEAATALHYDFIDLIFGRSTGGICATSTVICLISYLYLSNTSVYKKLIPPTICLSYIIISLLLIPFLGFNTFVNNTLNSTIVFASIFIATLPMYSPASQKEQIIFGISAGLFSAIIINFFLPYEGIYLVLLFLPFCSTLFKKIASKINFQKR